ncbi:MAG TPA: phosphoadenylyl-sulfate reductase [Bryobacteraceae bacterium]|jgi:phosphoadenosine phosphosulfate reductase|nr:phosphoadenylyl-sulfate reductase [Bryobacteraceae bacterium]
MSLSQRIDAARTLIRETLASEGPSAPAACITCSFQAEGMVVTHLVRQELPDIPVLFLDTGYHFPETYAYRDRMAAAWNLNLINLYPRQSVAEQEAELGILYRTAPDRCCKLRKVEPLFAALEAYDVWLTGLRREQSPSRAELQPEGAFRLPSGRVLRKISPLAFWSTREVWAYLKEFDIPILPLYDQGYTSIGCEPCTSLPVSVDDLRSGRWGGRKLECGIHLSAVPAE